MSNAKSKNPTKAEIAEGCRRYDRRLKASGATWHLELVLSREGEERVLATVAQYKNLREFTPEMRRKVAQAARLAVISSTSKAERTISQAEVAELVALFDGVISRLKEFEKRGDPDTGGSVEIGALALDVIDPVEIEIMEEHFRDCWVPGGEARSVAILIRQENLRVAKFLADDRALQKREQGSKRGAVRRTGKAGPKAGPRQ
jgi:hypothetical protein